MNLPVVILNDKSLLFLEEIIGDALIDPNDPGGLSYAHVYPDGVIKRFGNVIGHRDDLIDAGYELNWKPEMMISGLEKLMDYVEDLE